jgi:hypothetical protein
MSGSRTGLLVIRASLEEGSWQPLRAQIRLTTDVSAGFDHATTVAEVDATCEAVRGWLEQVLTGTRGR